MIIKNGKTISSIMKGSQVIDKIYKGTLVVYESFKNLLASGVPPLTLLNCKGVDLIDYKLYGNSVQEGTPTPDTPIEIESVGEKTKNLFDTEEWFNIWVNKNANEITKTTYKDKECYLVTMSTFYVTDYIPKEIKENTQYTLSADFISNTGFVGFRIYYTDGTRMDMMNINVTDWTRFSITSTANKTIQSIRGSGADGGNIYISNIQLEEGIVATEYEPYGYRIPVKVRGENFFNKDNMDKRNWYLNNGVPASAGTFRCFILSCEPLTEYTLQRLVATGGPLGIAFFDEYPNVGSVSTSFRRLANDTATCTSTENSKYMVCEYFYTGGSSGYTEEEVIDGITVSEGIGLSEYEPYIEPITTNIYLNEPLRKVDEYADYIDFVNQKVIRNIQEKKLLSTDDWGTYIYNTLGVVPFTIRIPSCLQRYGHSICSHFKNEKGAIWASNRINMYSDHPDGKSYYFNTNMTTLEEWREWLDNNELVLDYILETPTEETIELPNIPTLKGTTIIEVDTEVQPSNLEVVYKGK